MKQINLYTDGACAGNPGPGGWACLLDCGGRTKTLAGPDAATTNNRMELTAVIRGLQALKEPCAVTIHTDSRYVLDGAASYLAGWKKRGWKKADKKPVANLELWQELDALLSRHRIEWIWVKGHAGHPQNELVDQLACVQRDSVA
ncbi:MAG: ribonuclease HI [Alphaproteobacteria bacterium]|nr:ribonuclease HI [Alphaproteobacteria bacterium]